MDRYSYSGPVEDIFGNCLDRHFKAETVAVNSARARSNISYQWRQKMHYPKTYPIKLVGKLTKE